ncbi:MAG: RidA family protein [Ruminiclostridium sp.]
MDINERIKELNIILPNELPAPGGKYTTIKHFGEKLIYISGCGPNIGNVTYEGHLGKEISIKVGKKAAKACMLNILAILRAEIGDLNKVKSFVKLLAFVSSDRDFYSHPAIADGATELLESIFGKGIGLPTRSAIGVAVLPDNIPVEIEAIIELK